MALPKSLKFNQSTFIKNFSLNKIIFISSLSFITTACTVGPNYVRPTTPTPAQYKEVDEHWLVAQPNDAFDRGCWWAMFHDPELNALESQLNISNQTIVAAAASYQQAEALVDEARSGYFPTIAASYSLTRQKSSSTTTTSSAGTTTSSTTGATTTTGNIPTRAPVTTHEWILDGSWEPDLWGSVRRAVEASSANAQASGAQLANARLSAQATLAEDYFSLRALDTDQQLLDDTVKSDQQILKITQNKYKAGVSALADVVTAQSQVDVAQAAAINNGISRAQFEHALAVLIGQPPENFSQPYNPLTATPPLIPVSCPSVLLERRPDIAQQERLVAQANAQIGIAESAYFPNLLLTANTSSTAVGSDLISAPIIGWSLGAQLAETIFDGGLRRAAVAASKANYQVTVANYRQTVLAAFQDVEDNLASLRILDQESTIQNQAAANAKLALQLTINDYKAGTVDYSTVLTSQLTAFSAEKNAADVNGLRMSAAVGLIKALGGGWNGQVEDPRHISSSYN